MKLLGSIFAILLFVIVGGGVYLGMADIDVPQQTVTKDVAPASSN